ncbi:hypothetical protein [Limibacterium fermenti]
MNSSFTVYSNSLRISLRAMCCCMSMDMPRLRYRKKNRIVGLF